MNQKAFPFIAGVVAVLIVLILVLVVAFRPRPVVTLQSAPVQKPPTTISGTGRMTGSVNVLAPKEVQAMVNVVR